LYAYARRRVADRGEAQDLTQAFFAELLERDVLDTADPERGRFRAFLLTAFKHFCSKQWQRAKAQKRGGGRRGWSLDFSAEDSRLQFEPSTNVTADQVYEQQWALTLLAQVLTRLEDEHRQAGKERQFECLKEFLIGDHPGLTFSDAAAALEMTEAAARMATHRMRLRYRSLLREEIGHTVSGPEEIDEEIRRLFRTLG
jgi:RNA polymerase sigma-70 factor (ECF subfamily)